MNKKVYLASGFFNKETRECVEKYANLLRNKGYNVFVPMEHFVENGDKMSNTEWGQAVFNMDCQEIRNCDFMVMIDYGMCNDSGASWECGFAYGIGKPCYIVSKDNIVSIMTTFGSCGIVESENEIEVK